MTEPERRRRFMSVALALGARGLGRTWPNPAVGCVIAQGDRVLGRGWTQPGGRPHAETQALAEAGAAARGADVYVSLEPCAHTGRTPPCAQALIDAGVARVIFALRDPDPRVDGGGARMLEAADIEVIGGVMETEARAAHAGFLSRVQKGRPHVTLKLASSFDGRIATASGESRWITGPEARRHVHALRMRHDAVLVGGGTARADDPDLTARGLGSPHQPVRVVFSRHLDIDPAGRLGRTAREVPVWLVHGDRENEAQRAAQAAWEGAGARLFPVPVTVGGQLDPAAALRVLGDAGLTRVFCEGGGALAASLLAGDLVDRLIGFTAGLAIGAEGQPSIGAMGLGGLAEAPRFRLESLRRFGPDVCHEWVR